MTITAERRAEATTIATRRPERTAWLLPTCFGAASMIICFLGSWVPSLWGDEVTSVLSAERSLPSLFTMLGHVDAVHGTYYFFLHFWIEVFGASPVSVRFPSAIAAGFAIAGTVQLARRFAGVRAALFTGILCLALPRITYTGQEARGYAFSAALAVWVSYLLLELLSRRSANWKQWGLYAVGIAVCGYLFLFTLLLVPAHLLAVLMMRDRSLRRRWLAALSIAAGLAMPVIVYGVAERGQIAFLAHRTAATFDSVAVGQWFGNAACAALCWALIALAGGSAVWRHFRSRSGGRISFVARGALPQALLTAVASAWLLFPPAFLLLVNIVDPIYSSRYLTFAAPAFAVLVGPFLATVHPRWLGVLAAISVVGTAVPTYFAQRGPYAENQSDWADVAAYVHSQARPGDAILFDETINPSKRPRLAMRAYPRDFAGLKDVALRSPWWKTDNWDDSVYSLSAVPERLAGVTTAFLIEYRPPTGPADTYDISTLERDGYAEVSDVRLHSNTVLEFERR